MFSKKGFTLLELVVAIGILTIGLGGMVSVSVVVLNQALASKMETEALVSGQRIISEQTRLLKIATCTPGDRTVVAAFTEKCNAVGCVAGTASDATYPYLVSVTQVFLSNTLAPSGVDYREEGTQFVKITVNTTWNVKNISRTSALTQIVGKN